MDDNAADDVNEPIITLMLRDELCLVQRLLNVGLGARNLRFERGQTQLERAGTQFSNSMAIDAVMKSRMAYLRKWHIDERV